MRARVYLLLVLGFLLGPFLPLVIQSLAFRWAWPDLLPARWWWEAREGARIPLAWDYVLSPYSQIWEATVNTVVIGLAVTVICLILCLPAARLLARGRFRGKGAVEFLLALPLMVPEAAIGMALLMGFIWLGLAGTIWAIILVHLIPTIPYMTRALTASWQGLGLAAEEQARILGAGPWQVLWRVTLPMLLPGVLAGMLFAFLVSTNVFLLTFFMGQGQVVTLPTLLFAQIQGGALDAVGAGVALVAMLPGIALLVASQRVLQDAALGAVGR